MSLESAIQNLADELKRYNDGVPLKGSAPALVTAASSAMREDAGSKAEPKAEKPKVEPKPKAEKPKAETPKAEVLPTFDEVQKQAVDFVTEHPLQREALVTVLKTCGVQPVDMGGKQIYKISSVREQPEVLAKIAKALAKSLAEAAENPVG